jgi:protein TonB
MFGTLLATKPKREGKSAVAASLTSAILHVLIISGLVWASTRVVAAQDEEDVVALIPVQEEEPPPPPPPPPPQVKVEIEEVPTADVPKGFLTLAVPDVVLPEIPPPAVGMKFTERDFSGQGVQGGRADGNPNKVTAEDITAAPVFVPMTVAPELKNREEVARALERNYPPLLRDAGIGGEVNVWILIDEKGQVMKTQVHTASGYVALDEAALKVANIMKFSPAQNRDLTVKVWVSLPIKFTTK